MSAFQYLSCNQKLKDCFAYNLDDGGCRVLRDTRFKKKCPFYKLKEQYERECYAARQRQRERGKKDYERY